MKAKLPIIGLIKTGEDAESAPVKEKLSISNVSSVVDFAINRLSTETTISQALLKANKEWVYRNNDVIAKEVSKIDFELYTVGLKGGEIVLKPITSHPLLDMLDQMNSRTTKSDSIYITQSHKKLTGDAFWLLIKGAGGRPEAAINLQPDTITLKIADPTDSTDDLIEGYEYKATIDGKTVEHTYGVEDIIHFKAPNPNNMFRGLGFVEAAADTIDVDNLTNETTKKFFINGAITNFLLTTEGRLDDDQIKRLENQIASKYGRGAATAWKVMILGGGLKAEKLSFNNREMEFLGQLEWYRDKIMTLAGNTKASLGIIDDVNRAAHESSLIGWKRNTVLPDMEAIVNTLNEFLVPMFGKNLILGFKDPIPEDRNSIVDEVIKLKTSNIITKNEAREKIGYEPVPGGDEFDLNELPPGLKYVNVQKFLRRTGWYQKKEEWKTVKDFVRPYAEKIVNGKKKEPVVEPQKYHLDNDIAHAYWEKQIHVVEVIEQRFENKIKQFITTLEKEALSRLNREIDSKNKKTKDIIEDVDDLVLRAQLDFTPILMEVVTISGQQAMKLIDDDRPYIPFDIRNKVSTNVEKFAKSMVDTDKERLTNIITEGIEAGKSVPEISGEIRSVFDDMRKYQTNRVTRTEVLRASNMAAVDAWEQTGLVEAKQWLTAGAVDECEQYDGKIVTLSGNFYKVGEFKDGDPPLHPNCRCVVLPVLADTKGYIPATKSEKAILEKQIKELEAKVDKRSKAYKKLKKEHLEDRAYIKALESLTGANDEEE